MSRFAPVAFALLLLCACDAPAVGSWESDSKLGNGERNQLAVNSDLTGDAKIWATSCKACEDWTTFRFDFDWEDQGFESKFDMNCKDGPCDQAGDFKMTCEVIREDNGNEKMDCKGNGAWAAYPFDWQRAD